MLRTYLSEYCPKLLSPVERRAWKTGTLHKEWESICGDVQLQTSTISVLRKGRSSHNEIVVVCNLTPVPRFGYRLGVPSGGFWRELLNSDAGEYGGSGMGNLGGVQASERPVHGRPYSLELTLPPLGVLFLKAE